MQALRRTLLVAAASSSTIPRNPFHKLASAVAISKPHLRALSSSSSSSNRTGEDEWNDAWESAWLPEDLNPTDLAPWETGGSFPTPESASPAVASPADIDSETKAFVEEMEENWEERRRSRNERNQEQKQKEGGIGSSSSSLYSLENIKRDYRLKKQRIHAGLWSKEIEKVEEAKLGGSAGGGGGDDIDRLLDSCSEIFDSANEDLNDSKNPISSDFKNKPEGWETTSKAQDGNIWDMSQREEDILLQEFDRRIAYSKFQIASFIKTHIFSRRRPIDGWKYMIEELGPNAKRRGKGSVSRLPSLSDPSTQPFKEETAPTKSRQASTKSRHTASRRR